MRAASIQYSLCLLFAGALPAQDQDPTQRLDEVRRLHATFVAARDPAQAEMAPLVEQFKKAERGSPEQQKLRGQLNAIKARVDAPLRAFAQAFTACAWQQLDAVQDAAVLLDGLPFLIRDLGKAPQAALTACEFYLQHFPDDAAAVGLRANVLPKALLACDKLVPAATAMQAAIPLLQGPDKVRAMIDLGDLRAVLGETGVALGLYAAAAGLADGPTRRELQLRQDLVGKPAPELQSRLWIGAPSNSLSNLAGKVVLVGFWSTWNGPCRQLVPLLNALDQQHHAEGLEIMAVTQFYEFGYLPADPDQLQVGGRNVAKMTEATFPAHIATFRKNAGITYPLVIGSAEDFARYSVSSVPTLVLVDRQGKVAAVLNSTTETVLSTALTRLLAAK